jgi:hypothetical protein
MAELGQPLPDDIKIIEQRKKYALCRLMIYRSAMRFLFRPVPFLYGRLAEK